MEINIKPEDIDLYVKNAILESTVGKNIKEGIEKSLKEVFQGYRNPINDIVKSHMTVMIKNYMEQEDIKEKINLAVAKCITPEAIVSVVTYGLQKLQRDIDNN